MHAEPAMKQCPFCAEDIRAAAIVLAKYKVILCCLVMALLAAPAYCAEQPMNIWDAAEGGYLPVVLEYLKKGGDVNARNEKGKTPLHLAVVRGGPTLIRALLAHGADPNALDKDEEAPLMMACYNGHRETVVALLRAGADPNRKDKDGATPLILAARQSRIEVAALLLRHKATIDPPQKNHPSALAVAVGADRPAMVKFLLQNGANSDVKVDGLPLYKWAEKLGFPEVAKIVREAANLPGKNPVPPPKEIAYKEVHELFIDGRSPLTSVQQEEDWKRLFQGKQVNWKGPIRDVTGGRVYIDMGNSFTGLDISLDPAEASKPLLRKLQKGDTISFTGALSSQPGGFLPLSLRDVSINK